MTVVTTAQYRAITGDITTPDGDVTVALANAQEAIEDYLRRKLELGARTEICEVAYPSGFVYPLVTPIISVSDPSDTQVIDGQYLDTAGDDYPYPTGFSSWIRGTRAYNGRTARTTITYIGGWDSTTLPYGLRSALVDYAYAKTVGATPFVAGATSVSLGDASVSFGTSAPDHQLDLLVPGLTARLKGYRK